MAIASFTILVALPGLASVASAHGLLDPAETVDHAVGSVHDLTPRFCAPVGKPHSPAQHGGGRPGPAWHECLGNDGECIGMSSVGYVGPRQEHAYYCDGMYWGQPSWTAHQVHSW